MLDRLAAYGLEAQLFVHLVERLDRVGDQQPGASGKYEQPRRVGHQADETLALEGRVDNHPAELEDFGRQQSLEQLRRVEMAERQRRVREASRPERAD